MTGDFDDMQIVRRRCLALEQANGSLGEDIAALKQERARLWCNLNDLCYCLDNITSEQFAHGFDKVCRDKAKETLKEIRIN